MSLPKLKIEAGRGGRLGRSRMSYDDFDKAKEAARKLRRLADRRVCAVQSSPVDPAESGRRTVARKDRRLSENNLRRNPAFCPACLAPLTKVSSRSRLKRVCDACGAIQTRFFCLGCGRAEVWVLGAEAACHTCGRHGPRSSVIDRDRPPQSASPRT